MNFLRRLLERLTGKTFATRDDPRFIHCRSLVVLDEDRNVVYSGAATVEFTPNWGGVGALKVVSPTGIFPDISAETYRPSYSGDRARTPIGIAFSGQAEEGHRYRWLIDRAAENFMKQKVREQWVPTRESSD